MHSAPNWKALSVTNKHNSIFFFANVAGDWHNYYHVLFKEHWLKR